MRLEAKVCAAMPTFETFLSNLFAEGRIELGSSCDPYEQPTDTALAILHRAYNTYALELAGPAPAFDARLAARAAMVVRAAAWALVDRRADDDWISEHVRLDASARTPSEHASTDLALRYLPDLHRRACAIALDDPLTVALETLLRRYPLSGVLADLDDPPLAPLDFGGNLGLLMLYAERWMRRTKPAWAIPDTGPAAEIAALVRDAGRSRAEAQTRG